MPIFTEISFIILIATATAMIMRFLKQPLIIGYILAGFIAGPLVLDIIQSPETLTLFSKLGITILLFIIGLHLNPKIIREVGGVSLITGIGQIVFTSLIGTGISLLLGFSLVNSIFIGTAITFSSTIIILKLLHDKGDLEKLYGKISVGFLLVQDIAASIILLVVAVVAQSGSVAIGPYIGIIVLKVLALTLGLFAISKYVLPHLVNLAARSQETLFLFCLAWGMSIASLFVASGLSVEIGALVAGVALSTTAFATEISSRLRPLRDFFIVLFFILLGSEIVLESLPSIILPALFLSVFVLVGNPLIVFYLMNIMGYHKRTSFLAGLTVAQISEFSLILIALGSEYGMVDQKTVGLVTLVGLITIALSSYMIIYSNALYEYLRPLLSFLAIRDTKEAHLPKITKSLDALLFGYGRVGKDYSDAFEKINATYLVIDFDPQVISKLEAEDTLTVYGDAEDVEFMSELPLSTIKVVVSTISDYETDLLIVRQTRSVNKEAIVIVKSNNVLQAEDLYKAGASYVVMPHYIGANYAAKMIKRLGVKASGYKKAKEAHVKFLSERVN